MGFVRHLTAGEIVFQVLFLQQELQNLGESLRNVVFMGMGEPLHNYEAVLDAVDILSHPHALAFGVRKITLSTVGVVPGILRLAEENVPVNLAVSLHGATDEKRMEMVPCAKKWNLDTLMDACRHYMEITKRRIFFEWTLISGENDSPEQAEKLGKLLHGLNAHVNLIPLNNTAYHGNPSDEVSVQSFQKILTDYGVPSTVRQRRGIDVAASCGQLASRDG